MFGLVDIASEGNIGISLIATGTKNWHSSATDFLSAKMWLTLWPEEKSMQLQLMSFRKHVF